MSLYQFHFIGADGERPALDFAHCPDDGEAVREGMQHLRQHGSALAVEIWEGERMVVRMERASDQVRPVGAPVAAPAGRRAAGLSQPSPAFAARLQR